MGTIRFIFSLFLIVSALFLSSGVYTYYPGHEYWDNSSAGITVGFIHGAIAPIMLVGSIISEYRIYEPNNSGWFYDFSFILAFLIAWAGTTSSGTKVVNKYYNKNSKEKTSGIKVHEERIDKKISSLVNKGKKVDNKPSKK